MGTKLSQHLFWGGSIYHRLSRCIRKASFSNVLQRSATSASTRYNTKISSMRLNVTTCQFKFHFRVTAAHTTPSTTEPSRREENDLNGMAIFLLPFK